MSRRRRDAKKHGLPNVYPLYVDSIHGFALTKGGLLVAANCTSCHGSHRILNHKDPDSSTFKANIPKTCGSCHAGIAGQYEHGVHGKALAAGKAAAPVCTDCHATHSILQAQRRRVPDADHAFLRFLSQGAVHHLPRHVPLPVERPWRICGNGALLGLSWSASGPACLRSSLSDCACQSCDHMRQVSCREPTRGLCSISPMPMRMSSS